MQNRTCSIADCDTPTGKHGAKGYCPKHYKRFRATGDPNMLTRAPRGASPMRILEYHGWTVTDSGCWEYRGCRDKDGYGTLASSRKSYRAHRVAYKSWVGSLPDDLVLRHSCDNPPCINPEHLSVGTNRQNTHDALERMRLANGERHGMHKITDLEVQEIRELYAAGQANQYELAAKYECSQSQVSNIVRGVARKSKTWRPTKPTRRSGHGNLADGHHRVEATASPRLEGSSS